MGAIIAYDNNCKESLLSVSKETLAAYGAVSEETAKEMVMGVQKVFTTPYAIATTGIAGPDGGTDKKPIGTVCFGFYLDGEIVSVTKLFRGDRERIRNFSSLFAINFLRMHIKY